MADEYKALVPVIRAYDEAAALEIRVKRGETKGNYLRATPADPQSHPLLEI
jgi:hypothetical protein